MLPVAMKGFHQFGKLSNKSKDQAYKDSIYQRHTASWLRFKMANELSQLTEVDHKGTTIQLDPFDIRRLGMYFKLATPYRMNQ